CTYYIGRHTAVHIRADRLTNVLNILIPQRVFLQAGQISVGQADRRVTVSIPTAGDENQHASERNARRPPDEVRPAQHAKVGEEVVGTSADGRAPDVGIRVELAGVSDGRLVRLPRNEGSKAADVIGRIALVQALAKTRRDGGERRRRDLAECHKGGYVVD